MIKTIFKRVKKELISADSNKQPFSQIVEMLKLFDTMDQIHYPQIELLDKALDNNKQEQEKNELDILQYFTKYAWKANILTESDFYLNEYPSSIAIRLIMTACCYVKKQDLQALKAATQLLQLDASRLHYLILSRSIEMVKGLKAEREILDIAEQNFPNDELIILNKIDHLIRADNIKEANSQLFHC